MTKGQQAAPTPEDPAKGEEHPAKPHQTPPKRGRGRPSNYTKELGDTICARLYSSPNGAKYRALSSVIRDPDINVTEGVVFRWLLAHPDFREHYTFARERQADALAAEALALADLAFEGPEFLELLKLAGDAVGAAMHARVAQIRLQIDTRKWLAGKLAPKKYGRSVDELLADAVNQNAGNLDEAIVAMGKLDEQQAAKVYHDALKVGT
jgi:hypothetical protein